MKRLLLFALALLAVPSALGQYTRWDGYLTNAQGQAIQGAQVYILVQPATVSAYSPQAPVFSSVTGGALTQPLRTDGFGHVFAYVTETVNAAACSTLGSLCYTIVYISKSTGQVVLPDQVVGGGGGGTPPAGDCLPTAGGGPYPTANLQGEVMSLTNDGTGCASSMDLTTSLGSGPDGTLWFHQNWNIEMDSDVDPSGEQTLIQPTYWRMTSSTGNSGPAQIELQIDDSGGPGGGTPLLIEAQAVKNAPAGNWAGIDIQPSIGGASKASTDMNGLLIESLTAHLGQTFRNYHGSFISMTGVGGSNEEVASLIEAPNANIGANYCDVITRDVDGVTFRVKLGCGTTKTSTFAGPVALTGSGAAQFRAVEGTPCDAPTAGTDIICADSVAHAITISNNGAAYFTPGAGGGGSAFSAITGSTNTTAAMVVGTGASIAPSGSGTIQATNIASTITASTNVTITGAGTVASPYAIAASGGGGGGNYTLISDQVLGSPAATVTFAAISGSYKHLKLFVQARCSGATTNDTSYMQANADTGANYDRQFLLSNQAGTAAGQNLAVATLGGFPVPCANATANNAGTYEIEIPNYAGTTFYKSATVMGEYLSGNTAINWTTVQIAWKWANTAAITQLLFALDGGSNFVTGSRFTLYGIN